MLFEIKYAGIFKIDYFINKTRRWLHQEEVVVTKETSSCKVNHPNETETVTNRSHIEYEMMSFNDALAHELIRIRSDLISLQVKQKNKDWECFPDEFLKIFYMYRSYKSSAICKTYQTPADKKGGIVILLDCCDLTDFRRDGYSAENTLRKLNSKKENRILSGMELPIYIYDPEFPDAFHPPMAKVLSISKDEFCVTIVLEINTSDANWISEKFTKFTRKINIYENAHFFIPD